MDKPFGRLIRSDLFTFLIGPEKVPFIVHAEPIARQSPALHGLLNGNMAEADSKTVVWPDVDEDTFVRFCEFCYFDNYSPPSCGWDGDTVEEPAMEPMPVEDDLKPEASPSGVSGLDFGEPQSGTALAKRGGMRRRGFQSLSRGKLPPGFDLPENLRNDQEYPLPEKCTQFTEQFKPFSNVTDDQDFTPVFLGHARLYVMADKYCIEALKELVLYKLQSTLKCFTLFPNRIRDVIKLIQFTYDEDNTRGGTEKMNPLRRLVTQYTTTVLENVAMHAAFLELLQ